MIKIVPDKEGKLTQWDLNRKVIVTGYDGGAEVHFASPGDDHGAYVVKLVDGEAEIPNILLTMAGTINVYVYPADRTVFATTLWVMAREKPDDYVYTETEVLNWRTLDEKIGDLADLTTTARENLVAAINEAATKGMASIYMRVAEGYIEYSGDGVNWKQLIAVAELKGDKGDKGDPGSDATVDIVTPTAESTDTQAASAKAVWDMLGGGGSGTDISLGVTGASVGDIVKVKAVDDSGKPTAWEAAEAKLANPNALTFTGAVTGSYDGTAPLSVEIPSGGGGSGLSDYILIDTLDWSTEELAQFYAGKEYSFEEIHDILLVYTGVANDTTTVSGLTVVVNNITLASSAEPMSGKSGNPMNGYVFLHSIPGIGLFSLKTPGAISSNNYTTANANIAYNFHPVTEKITKFKIHNRATSYCTNMGILKIYAR